MDGPLSESTMARPGPGGALAASFRGAWRGSIRISWAEGRCRPRGRRSSTSINEAFAAQYLAVERELGVKHFTLPGRGRR
jgi:hypothetical protein